MTAGLRHNLGLKLISLLVALTVWGLTRVADPIEEWSMQVEVSERLPGDLALVSRVPAYRTIEVYVRGRLSDLNRIQRAGPKAVLDGRGMVAGETRAVRPRLEPSVGHVHTEFAVSSFDVTVDQVVQANFTPEEVTEGQPPAGLFVESRYGLPATVSAKGAKPLMERVARVVYYLNLGALSGSTELAVEFVPVDSDGKEVPNITLEPRTANIGINFQPSQSSRTVPIVVDYQGNPAPNHAVISLSCNPFMVEVYGPPESLAGIRNVRTAPINLTGKTTSFEQVVNLMPPSANVSLSVSRATVDVQIQQLTTKTTFSDVAIDVSGRKEGYRYEVFPETVEVVIEVPLEQARTIASDMIRPKISVEGLEEGEREVRVTVDLPSGVRLSSVRPGTVTVSVTRMSIEEEEGVDGGEPEPE